MTDEGADVGYVLWAKSVDSDLTCTQNGRRSCRCDLTLVAGHLCPGVLAAGQWHQPGQCLDRAPRRLAGLTLDTTDNCTAHLADLRGVVWRDRPIDSTRLKNRNKLQQQENHRDLSLALLKIIKLVGTFTSSELPQGRVMLY